MNRVSDLRDLCQLWADDVASFEEQGRIDRITADALGRFVRSYFTGLVSVAGVRRLVPGGSGKPSSLCSFVGTYQLTTRDGGGAPDQGCDVGGVSGRDLQTSRQALSQDAMSEGARARAALKDPVAKSHPDNVGKGAVAVGNTSNEQPIGRAAAITRELAREKSQVL